MTHHICCRDCQFEKLVDDSSKAGDLAWGHAEETGHRVASDSIDGGELVTDGGVDDDESFAAAVERVPNARTLLSMFREEGDGRLMADGGAREETIANWLIINWREGTTRTRKSKPDPSSLGTHELATSLTLNVTIPDVDVPELVADVEVPQPRVEASELSDLEAEESPDWMDVADEVVDDNPDADPFDEVDRLVVAVLEDAPDRPDVAEVKRYLQNQLRQRRRGEQA